MAFYFYICSFNFLNVPDKYTYCSLHEKTLFILFVYCMYLYCVSLFSFIYNKDEIITKIFIFTHFGLNILLFIFCYLERLK